MPYVLGVDVGTTRTAAAVCRLGGAGRGEPEPVGLGGPGGGVATVLRLTADGAFAVGEPGDPRWTATGFARRVGDEVPVVLGAERCPPEELTALLVRWVVNQVAAREGGQPEHVVVAHPPAWGAHAKGLLHHALRAVGVEATLVPEPVAAAENHAFTRPLTGNLGVFSLGSHWFGSAVVGPRFELVASAEGVEQDAGADFDDAVFAHVRASLGRELDELDAEDPRTRGLFARLRHDCEAAKRVLSGAVETAVPVHLPSGRVDVPLTRARFEELIRPAVEQAVAVHARVAAGVEATVLVGGSARIPLVAASVPGRVVLEAAPETSVVKGAALAARRLVLGPEAEPEPVETSVLVRDDPLLRFPVGGLDPVDGDFAPPPPRPPVDITPLDLPERRSVKRVVRGLAPTGGHRRARNHEDGR
ncbi:Hsp70 family protein [Saccharothrix syringae]|uniref:Hsp70 family protein n=1 Tax=Saccharothrix syringae TaxID=103733 RepID=A0A5Q0GR51_SACSY|nr:Hsp70 family protein [Saccharothrix syringae]QFZ16556.1 Hsp70 family protein [Saccharothrix syringae]